MRLHRSMAATFVAGAALFALPHLAQAQTLTGGAGFLYDFQSGGYLSNGSIDAYDACYYLAVDGTTYSSSSSTATLSGRGLEFPAMSVGTLSVQRFAYVPEAAVTSGADWVRYLDVVSNPGSSDVSTTISITGNLGSDSGTSVFASSSGDTIVSIADGWFSTDDSDGSGDPSLAHVAQAEPGSGSLVEATALSISSDNITYTFAAMVPAGGRIAILSYAIQASSQSAAQTEARRLETYPDDALVELDDYRSDIVNWPVGAETTVCDGVAEGGACTTSRGVNGQCHASACCTGCWNGTRCVSGTSPSACGAAGAACAACADADDCTSDVCTAGVCTNPNAPRGTACTDALFCTGYDFCDGAGHCTGTNRCDDGIACTTDACNESTRACANTPPSDQCIIGRSCVAEGSAPSGIECLVCNPSRSVTAWSATGGGCAIGGECIAEGTHHPTNPCLVCNPAVNDSDWSLLAEGEVCLPENCAGGRLYGASTCSAEGACVTPSPTRCAAGYCASETECQSLCEEGGCPGDSYCAPSGACELRRAVASSCVENGDCVSGFCVEGICCDTACTDSCFSCGVPGSVGTCSAVPEGTDPDRECAGGGTCTASGVCSAGDAGPPDAGIVAVDAGRADGSVALDAAISGPDASTETGSRSGCSASPGTGSTAAWAVALGALIAAVVRRRR